MLSDFQYKTVRKYLEQKRDSAILETFDKLAEAALIFAPVAFGAQFLPLWELLDIKDRLVNMGRSIVNFVAKQTEPTYIERAEQIKIAYGMICFTAYFEAVSELLPRDIIKDIKESLANNIEEQRDCPPENQPLAPSGFAKEFHREIPFADEVLSHSEVKTILLAFYRETSQNLLANMQKSDAIKKAGRKKQSKVKRVENALSLVAERALEFYEAQYIDLGITFNDFGFYAQMCEFNALSTKSLKNEAIVGQFLDRMNGFDVGMTGLATVLNRLPTDFRAIESQEIVEELKKKYRAEIEKPIINDRENEKEIVNHDEETKLSFPRIIDAFIPQAYKCLTYDNSRKGQKLEDDHLWAQFPIGEDIGTFFVKYLSSPMSIDYPLIILGHPGSGKSVLTKIISAQLMCDTYTVVRIPLREINPDLDIVNIIADQIKKDSQCALSGGYGLFAKQFNEKPLLVIFDGYDELLQAKGQVFSGYLKTIHTFQQDQRDRRIPVRVVVTSRITLIDKAIIPENSSILRLLEFDQNRRNRWIEIWNQTNESYFSPNSGILPFSLPPERTGEKSSIIELAEQPLLLLMLAIYDSENNELKELGEALKRTVLYDDLLQRFVRRERSRYDNFERLSNAQQQEEITKEMKRLGVVAIGMFNRRKLHINSSELEPDLKTYDVLRLRDQLKDSDSLFGSFFFIHKSTAQDISNDSQEVETAFEFLHNTFGEFLTADLILRYVIDEVSALKSLRNAKSLHKEYTKKLYDPNALCDEWFINLMFTPLYTRPVVLEMIREHLPNVIAANKLTQDEFTEHLQALVEAQLRFFLKPQQLPNALLTGKGEFGAAPTLSYISTYTMNLVILSALVLDEGFVFNEDDYKDSDASNVEMRPWDKLTSLWRAWFSADNLVGLSAILKATRQESYITVKCYKQFEANKETGKVEMELSVAASLADELSASLSGLQTSRFCDIMKMDENAVAQYLEKIDPNFRIAFIAQRLNISINGIDYDDLSFGKINELINILLRYDSILSTDANALIMALNIVETALVRRTVYLETQKELLSFTDRIIERLREERVNIKVFESFNHISYLISISLENVLFFNDDRYIRTREPGMLWDRNLKYMHIGLRKTPKIYSKYFFDSISPLREAIDPLWYDDERADILTRDFSKRNVGELLRTNPTVTSRLMYLYLQHKTKGSEMLQEYFDCFVDLIRSVGIDFIGSTALLYSIRIAKKVRNSRFLEYITDSIRDFLSSKPNEYLSYLIIYNPGFLNAILELSSELLNASEIRDMIFTRGDGYFNEFIEHRIVSLDLPVILDYIELYRKFAIIPSEFIDKMIHDLFKRLPDGYFRMISKTINISQYGNLLWYSKKTENKEVQTLLRQLKEQLDL